MSVKGSFRPGTGQIPIGPATGTARSVDQRMGPRTPGHVTLRRVTAAPLPPSAVDEGGRLLGALRTRAGWRTIWRCAWPPVAIAAGTTVTAYLLRSRIGAVLEWDQEIIRRATDFTREHPDLRTALLVWEHAFLERYVYGVGTLACWWVWRRRRHVVDGSRAVWAFLAMMLVWNLNLDLKYVVRRLRPVVDDPVSLAPGFSFPSGHTANTAAATTAVLILVWPLLGSGRVRVGAVVVGATLSILTALDRVFLGVHYPTDVSAGLILGPGMIVASYVGYRMATSTTGRRAPAGPPTVG